MKMLPPPFLLSLDNAVSVCATGALRPKQLRDAPQLMKNSDCTFVRRVFAALSDCVFEFAILWIILLDR